MAMLENSIIAHIDVKGEKFEILVDPDLGYLYKVGKKQDLNNILRVEEVFKNARKGERQTSAALQKAFGTTDVYKIAEIILKKGEMGLTTEQRRKMLEEKKKQIIAILARECVDPRTGAPHPVMRLENALKQAKVNIDPFKDASAQLDKVIKELRVILPLKFEKVRIAVKIPPEHAQRAYGILKEYNMEKKEWQQDGSLIVLLEMPAGVQGEFYNRINKLTSGNVETRIVK